MPGTDFYRGVNSIRKGLKLTTCCWLHSFLLIKIRNDSNNRKFSQISCIVIVFRYVFVQGAHDLLAA